MPTVAELKAKCKSLGIKGYSKLKKAELIALIESVKPAPERDVFFTPPTTPFVPKASNCPPCTADKICNPNTGRCILKSGKKGKEILNRGKLLPPKKYRKFNKDEIHNLKVFENFLNEGGDVEELLKQPEVKKYLQVILPPFVFDKPEYVADAIRNRFASITPPMYNIWINLPLNKIKHLVAITFYKFELGDRTFYLIGENHKFPHICNKNAKNAVFITGLIDAVSEAFPNKTFDLFFEADLLIKNFKTTLDGANTYETIGISLLLEKYKGCLDLDKPRNCGNNIRVHYSDFRNYIDFKYGVSNAELMHYDPSGEKLEQIKDKISELVTTENKLLKQYTAIKDKKLSEEIYYWFLLEKLFKAPGKLGYIIPLMDMYTAGRMFRNFGNYHAKNIIYYAGASHIRIMKELLKHLGAKKIVSVPGQLDMSCMKLDFTKVFN